MCLRLHARHARNFFPIDTWAITPSPRSRIRQAGRPGSQTKKLPRGNAGMTASCTVISGASATATASRLQVSLCLSKRGPAEVTSWPARGTSTFCTTTPALALCTTCKPRLCLSLSFSSLHGSWSMALYTYRALQLHCSLERKNPGSSRNSPPRTCLSPAAPDPSRPLVRLGTAFYFATADSSHGFEACN